MASTTIIKRGDVWQYRIQYVVNGERKSVSKSGFKNKRDARDAAVLKESELNSGVDVSASQMLLADYMTRWKQLYKDGNISEHSSIRIGWIIEYVRINYNPSIKDVTLDDYQSFLNQLAQKYAKETVKKYHTYIKAALTHAVRTGVLARNPAEGAIVKGNKQKQKSVNEKFISQEEFKQLEEALLVGMKPSYTSRYVILFSMFTGARLGECLGMTWDCVDFQHNKIRIEKGWDYHVTNTFTDGKTPSSKRTIVVPQKLMDLLQTLPRDNDRLFNNVSPTAANKTLKKFLNKIGCETNLTFHGLRHTHASILLAQGINILSVSKRLGHADINETLTTYAHVLRELENHDNEKILEVLK